MCVVLWIREQLLTLHLKKPNNNNKFVYCKLKDLLISLQKKSTTYTVCNTFIS
jgi:hypothetical protein